jgi:hypothetical protein
VNYNLDESGKMVPKKFEIEMMVMPRNLKSPSNMSASKIREIIHDNLTTPENALSSLRYAYTYSMEGVEIQLLEDDELMQLFQMVKEGMEIGRAAKLSTTKKSKKGRGRTRRGYKYSRKKRTKGKKRVRFNV